MIGGFDVSVTEDRGRAQVCVRFTGTIRTSSEDFVIRLRPVVKTTVSNEATREQI